jgi:large subunit ribosomal protein L31
MKPEIHPKYVMSTVTCACGASFVTRSIKPVINLDICAACHPFFTGKQKLLDTAGRVEKFQKRFSSTEGKMVEKVIKPVKTSKTTTPKRIIKTGALAKIADVKDSKAIKADKKAAKAAAKTAASKEAAPKAAPKAEAK